MWQIVSLVKVKMTNYELVVILSPELADDGVRGFIDRLKELVGGIGGSVEETVEWGRRKLAYPIKRRTEGNYVLAKVKLQPSSTRELESSLRLREEVLRHLLVKING